jgi:hypothetical protein
VTWWGVTTQRDAAPPCAPHEGEGDADSKVVALRMGGGLGGDHAKMGQRRAAQQARWCTIMNSLAHTVSDATSHTFDVTAAHGG